VQRAVFLDRDGVLTGSIVRNGRPYAPTTLEEFFIIPGTREALERLRQQGFLLIVATNQPDVGRGKTPRELVETMHARLSAELPLDEIRTCWDGDEATSRTYKPKPGMLLDAAEAHGIDLARSYMVGDRWRDVGCGRAAGCYTVFIDYGYEESSAVSPDATCANLAQAVDIILAHAGAEEGK
jgi:D-glycero-D-manno-heptose 1,7-bisphosphate phosphatase